MARGGTPAAQHAANGTIHRTHSQAQVESTTHSADAEGAPLHQRVRLVDKDVGILSLPARDLPSYYDPPSSPSAASGSDGGGPSDALTSLVPTTNRGHKLSRLAPHTRRGRLGHHANVDAGFVDPTTSSSLAPPAQKRRKLNDLAAASSTSGFAVAPNLHLVPRGMHVLTREPDAPSPAHLPPVPQSPLDLLLNPAVQHTLGRKNHTFHLLAASATSLIEQEAELVGALTKVCRGLRGEGFGWPRESDAKRRPAEEAERRKQEEGPKNGQVTRNKTAADPPAVEEDAVPPPPPPARVADHMEVDASPAPTTATSAPALEDEVKLEQATPVLSAPTAPGAVADPILVPGTQTPAPAVGGSSEERAASPGTTAQVRPMEGVERTDAASADAPADGAEAKESTLDAPPAVNDAAVDGSSTEQAPSASTPVPDGSAPSTATETLSNIPAIAVTEASAEGPATSDVPTDSTMAPAPAAGAVANPELSKLPSDAPTDAAPTAGATEPVTAPAVASPALVDTLPDAPSTEVTPAPSLSEEPSVRRRSGRVARETTGGGAAPGRHTRSRQSSPEEGFTDADEDVDGAGEGSSVDEPLAAGVRGARGPPTVDEEEDLPEYAARLVDPEVFVRSLFVSEGNVEMERVVPGPGGGVVGTGQMETLKPNEQEVLLHDCLTDLHRFLADTLEYRSRLLEIRDGTLGVERRRKGMFKCVRTVAMDWLQEEGAGMGAGLGAGEGEY